MFGRDHPIVKDAVDQYGLTPEFVVEYLGYQGFQVAGDCLRWDDLRNSLAPLSRMYVDFAMTCVQRARGAADHVVAALPPMRTNDASRRRYLDVGCGYGGFVREFTFRGFDAVGVELQRHLAAFSRANCIDLPTAQIVEGDVLDMGGRVSGEFHAITCNDVIEHVKDARKTIEVLASKLASRGVLFLEIPNKDCIQSVASDGHYQQFGLTLLERHASAGLLQATTGASDYLVEMGEMYPLSYYVSALRSHGLIVEVRQVHRVGAIGDSAHLARMLINAWTIWTDSHSDAVGAHLRQHVDERVGAYLREFWSGYVDALSGTGREDFELRFLNAFWTVIARRP